MEPVEYIDCIARFLGDHLQIRFPHVATDKLQRLTSLLAEPTEESQQRLDRALLPDPQQPLTMPVDPVNQRQIAVAPLPVRIPLKPATQTT